MNRRPHPLNKHNGFRCPRTLQNGVCDSCDTIDAAVAAERERIYTKVSRWNLEGKTIVDGLRAMDAWQAVERAMPPRQDPDFDMLRDYDEEARADSTTTEPLDKFMNMSDDERAEWEARQAELRDLLGDV